MKLRYQFAYLNLLFILFFNPFSWFDSPPYIKKRALADLEFVKNVFEIKYAPTEWKKDQYGWDLDTEYKRAKRKIEKLEYPTAKNIQCIFRDFFNSTRDYHVGGVFFSTEKAYLPFFVKRAGSRYFFTYVNSFANLTFPFKEGDEILTFDGHPIDEVVQKFREKEFGSNVPETDQALAELSLTCRSRSNSRDIPKGFITIEGIQKNTGKVKNAAISWQYLPEQINDYSKSVKLPYSEAEYLTDNRGDESYKFFSKKMVFSQWQDSPITSSFFTDNKHVIGSRLSYIPPLGAKVWSSPPDSFFDAYIFHSPTHKRIGYVRIPHYGGCKIEAEEFKQIIRHFQNATDALVIDQINNPGGYIFYSYALLSLVAGRPLEVCKHRIMLTQEEIFEAANFLSIMDLIRSDQEAEMVFGNFFLGYPVSIELIKKIKPFCNFIIDEWSQGKTFTDSTHFFGIDKIQPNPNVSYNKPILLLVNSLDFSAGDFFPAILQDNNRATIFGTRTAGAGGYIHEVKFPNYIGLDRFILTASIAERKDQKLIENLGVTPDIFYELSETDLQENYCEYVQKILESLEEAIQRHHFQIDV